jgi:co-chaperonin GroES (HSP10)
MKEVANKMVAIFVPELKSESVLQESEISREQLMKKQNRGIVHLAGKECAFVQKGDDVSFYRAASTPVTGSDGVEYEIVNEGHILAKF